MARWNCLKRMCTGKRLLMVFGVMYGMSVITLIHNTARIDSEVKIVAEDDPFRRNVRSVSNNSMSSNLTSAEAANITTTTTTAAPPPVNNKEDNFSDKKEIDCSHVAPPRFLEHGVKPLTALHSFPGSGNTWVRVLLSSLTGYNTGDIYKDGAFAKTPGFSFKKDDTVIAVKTHHPFWDDNNGPDPSAPRNRYWERSIIVIRHPLDATISVYNWFRMRGSHTKAASLDKYIKADGTPTKEWNKWAHDQIRNWGRCLDYWINTFKGPKVIVFYEDLVANLEEQLVLINEFLELPLDPTRLACTLQSQAQQKFHRKQKIDKRKLYDTSMLNEVELVLEKSMHLLSQNYTHTRPGFKIPANYAVNLIRENFSIKPTNISESAGS